MSRKYIAVINENADGFEVIFPDFLGCISVGKTLIEAKQNAQEALELHIKGMCEDKEDIPNESDLEKVSEWAEECDGKLHLIWVIPNIITIANER